MYEDRCAKHRYRKSVRCRVIKPHTRLGQAQAVPKRVCRTEPSQALLKNTQRRVYLLENKSCALFYQQYTPFILLSVSRRYYLRWYHTALMMMRIFILRQGRTEPKPSQAKRSQCTRGGQVHETSIPKIGRVSCNKASHLLVEAKPSHAQAICRAEPSRAKPSLIYKYTKKGVCTGGQGLCLVLPARHPLIYQLAVDIICVGIIQR